MGSEVDRSKFYLHIQKNKKKDFVGITNFRNQLV